MSYSPPTLARTHCVLFYFQAWSSSSRSLLWRYTASPRGVMTVLATARGYVGGGAVGVVQQRGVPSMPCDNLLVLVICACVYFSYVLCGTVSITVSYLYVAHTYTHTHTPPTHTHTHTHTAHTHTHTPHTHHHTHTTHTHTHTHTHHRVYTGLVDGSVCHLSRTGLRQKSLHSFQQSVSVMKAVGGRLVVGAYDGAVKVRSGEGPSQHCWHVRGCEDSWSCSVFIDCCTSASVRWILCLLCEGVSDV